jgi:hypothetical protein
MFNVNTGIQSCKGCVFEKLKKLLNDDGARTYCELNRLKAFEKVGANIHFAVDGSYKINRRCNLYRNADWFNKWFENRNGENDYIAVALKEVEVKYSASIIHKNYSTDVLEKLLKELAAQPIPPVTVIVGTQKLTDSEVIHLGEFISGLALPFQFVIRNSKEELNDRAMHDLMFDKVDGTYVVFMNTVSGKSLPDDFSTRLNNSLNEELKQLVLIRGDGYDCVHAWVYYDIRSKIFKHPGTLPDFNVIKEIKTRADKESNQKLIEVWK